ncbi:ATP-dependent metallopeptidase FtsH/Yme1/Tma family protein, partial [candidate division KSB1 bacterium]|nr:ATP-dependent metallopeptidase FtsH/Yme1/Tma family protein [candidate division KSB1 bacterium]
MIKDHTYRTMRSNPGDSNRPMFKKSQKQTPKPPGRRPNQSDNKRPPEGPQWGKVTRPLILWIAVITIALFLSQQFSSSRAKQEEIDWDQFMQLLEGKKIESAVVQEDVLHGKLIQDGSVQGREEFRVVLPPRVGADTF